VQQALEQEVTDYLGWERYEQQAEVNCCTDPSTLAAYERESQPVAPVNEGAFS
jgi:hypothetical protein